MIYQSTERNEDLITNFDYDGNWNGYDNWENFPCYPKRAYVHYSIVESTSYYFITYNFFHPKDLGNPAVGEMYAHENDFEGCRVLVVKDGSQWGRFGWLETIAHTENYRYYPGEVEFDGSHPKVYVTPYKHAVYGTNDAKYDPDCWYLIGCRVFPSREDTGVIYRYAGIAEVPESLNDRNVGYDLIDLTSTIWARRFEWPHRECGDFATRCIVLHPEQGGYLVETASFGKKFGGDNYSYFATMCNVPPPWNYQSSVESSKGKVEGGIGWLDDTMVDKKTKKMKKLPKEFGGTLIKFPLTKDFRFRSKTVKLKEHKNWKKDAKILALTFTPAYNDFEAVGRFRIWRIELVKVK